jgi:SAM-dependent MidA family methyltransferase
MTAPHDATTPADDVTSGDEVSKSDDFAITDDFALAGEATPLRPTIDAAIEAGGGRITFAAFMALALGDREYGYYSRPGLRWGRDGDYETSPEVHPIFGYLWARQIVECWERLGRPAGFELVEPGAGSGAFMTAVLTWLQRRAPQCLAAAHPRLLDGHANRLADQQTRLGASGFEARHTLLDDWLAEKPSAPTIVIANEFFDALPAHLVERRGDELHEWYVMRNGDGPLRLTLGALSDPALERYFERIGVLPGDGCRAEVSLAAIEAMQGIARRAGRGYILAIDYGHEATELYASWRRMGTLMAFRDHSPQPDPLASPGLLDLTYHVDFTSLAAAAEGWTAAATTSQAEALTALGIADALRVAGERAAEDVGRYASERRAAETLVDPTGLGRIRVLALARDADLEGLRCLAPLPAPGGGS